MPNLTAAEAIRTIGPYDVLETLSKGKMATVFLARHRENEQAVAIKAVFPPQGHDEILLKRFQQEFRASSLLRHPNIVRALDFGHDNTITYLVMEYVNGLTLAEHVKAEGPMSEAKAVRAIVQVAEGLHFAHKNGIVHRDVTPGNILLPTKGQAKLSDLGLIKDLETDLGLTRQNIGMGTPCFMAPEQFRNAKHAGVRCDIYSLGATLYFAVTGQLPFRERGVAVILQKKLANDVTPPRKLASNLSERVERAILRAIRSDPDVRPRSCLEFIEVLTVDDKKNTPRAKVSGLAAGRAGKQKSDRGSGIEQRASVRYSCNVDSACRRNTSIHASDEHQDVWEATVQDLSVRGAGLIVNRRFEIGALVTLDFRSTGSEPRVSADMRVARVDRAGRSLWFVGGSFVKPLDKETVRSLV
jgi:serine/threonine protein kinase